MTSVTDAPGLTLGEDLGIDLVADVQIAGIGDTSPPLIVGDTENEDDEELDIEEFDDDDFDDEFDDDFEDEDEGEYDVVEEFEDDFTFVDPATKKPVTHSNDVEEDKEANNPEDERTVPESSPKQGADDGEAKDEVGGENANES